MAVAEQIDRFELNAEIVSWLAECGGNLHDALGEEWFGYILHMPIDDRIWIEIFTASGSQSFFLDRSPEGGLWLGDSRPKDIVSLDTGEEG